MFLPTEGISESTGFCFKSLGFKPHGFNRVKDLICKLKSTNECSLLDHQSLLLGSGDPEFSTSVKASQFNVSFHLTPLRNSQGVPSESPYSADIGFFIL